jgi:hypothetical protein
VKSNISGINGNNQSIISKQYEKVMAGESYHQWLNNHQWRK